MLLIVPEILIFWIALVLLTKVKVLLNSYKKVFKIFFTVQVHEKF